MTPYERVDIVLVPYPFFYQSTTKKRPAMATSQAQKSTGLSECMITGWSTTGLLEKQIIGISAFSSGTGK